MSNKQGITYDADNLVNLTPGSLTYNGTTYDVAASGSAAAAQATANAALAAAAAAQATANAALPKAGGTMTGDISMGGTHKVTNLATPTANGDATNKQYVDTLVTGVLRFKGSTDCSGNPNYPAAVKGDAYVVSVAGKIGGAAGIVVEVGDVFFAIADNAGGTQAAVGSSWDVLQYNLNGVLLAVNNLSDVQNVATARTNLGLGTAATYAATAFAQVANNLSDLASAATARTNLGLGTAATYAATAFAQVANNLSDLASAATARTNLGLGTAATYAATAFAQTANNLSDLASAATARTNLGLGTAATQNSTAFATSAQGTLADGAAQKSANLSDLASAATARTNLGLGTAAIANSTDFATAAQGTLASTAVQRAGDTMTGNLQVNAYIGIGAAPTTTFDIYQTNAGLNSNFRLRGNAQSVTVLDVASGTSGHYLFGYGAVPMQLATNGVTRMTIASTGAITQTSGLTVQSGGITVTGQSQITGNVGIGAAPTTQFDVYAPAGNNANMRVRGDNGNAQFDFASGTGGHYLYGYGTLPVDFASNGVSRMTIASTGNITVKISLQIGTAGTAITQQTVYLPTLTPAAVGAAGFSKQTFTVTGLATNDTVIVNGPNATALSALVSFRVSAANTLELTWFCQGALTPAAGTYRIVAIRS